MQTKQFWMKDEFMQIEKLYILPDRNRKKELGALAYWVARSMKKSYLFT